MEEEARAIVQAEEARWRDQTNLKALTKEARQRGWIERGDKWRVAAEAPEQEMDEMGMFESGMDMDMDMHMDEEGGVEEEVLAEHLQELFEEKMSPASHGALECLGPSVEDRSLPRCTIDTTNMSGFRLGTLEPQVRGRCKVVRDDCGMGFGDDGGSDDDDSGGGGSNGGGSSGGDDDAESEEEEEGEEEEEEEEEGEESGVPGGDPRGEFMRMMMATGMPQLAGLHMIPGRMGSGGPSLPGFPGRSGGGPFNMARHAAEHMQNYVHRPDSRPPAEPRHRGPSHHAKPEEDEEDEDEAEEEAQTHRRQMRPKRSKRRDNDAAGSAQLEASYSY